MIKRMLFVAGILGAASLAIAAVVHFGYGRGVIRTDHGLGRFGFEVAKMSEHVRGRAQFAEFVPGHAHPTVEIVMPEARAAHFTENSVVFVGPGAIRRPSGVLRVGVEVRAIDNHGTKHPDAFAIRCFNPHTGAVVYQAGGPLQHGDIVVGHREE
jgi:hypothetical protein